MFKISGLGLAGLAAC